MKTTFADIAAKIKTDVDKYQKIISDVSSTKIAKHTAELNLETLNQKLSRLAELQEQQKMSMQIAQPEGQMEGPAPQFRKGGKTPYTGPDGTPWRFPLPGETYGQTLNPFVLNPDFTGTSGVYDGPTPIPLGGNPTPITQTTETSTQDTQTGWNIPKLQYHEVPFGVKPPEKFDPGTNWASYVPGAANMGMGLFGKPDLLTATDYMTNAHKDPLELDVRPEMQQLRQTHITNNRKISNLSPSQVIAAQIGSGDWKSKAIERLGRMKNEYDTNQVSQADNINLGISARNAAMKLQIDDYNAQVRANKDNMFTTGADQLAVAAQMGRNDNMMAEQMYREQENAYNNLKFQNDRTNAEMKMYADSYNTNNEIDYRLRHEGIEASKVGTGQVVDGSGDGNNNTTFTASDYSYWGRLPNGSYPPGADQATRDIIDRVRTGYQEALKKGTKKVELKTPTTKPTAPAINMGANGKVLPSGYEEPKTWYNQGVGQVFFDKYHTDPRTKKSWREGTTRPYEEQVYNPKTKKYETKIDPKRRQVFTTSGGEREAQWIEDHSGKSWGDAFYNRDYPALQAKVADLADAAKWFALPTGNKAELVEKLGMANKGKKINRAARTMTSTTKFVGGYKDLSKAGLEAIQAPETVAAIKEVLRKGGKRLVEGMQFNFGKRNVFYKEGKFWFGK